MNSAESQLGNASERIGWVGKTRVYPSVTGGAAVELVPDLPAGTWRITAENNTVYFHTSDDVTFNRTIEGRMCPRDKSRLFEIHELDGHRNLTLYVPAGAYAWIEQVGPYTRR